MNLTLVKLNADSSVKNRWRSFLHYFNSKWNTTTWPALDYPVFLYSRLTKADAEKCTKAKAWLTFEFDTFAGGRCQEDDIFIVEVTVRHEHNVYDSLILDLLDAIQDAFESLGNPGDLVPDGIPVLDFNQSGHSEIGGNAGMFPIINSIEVNPKKSDDAVLVVDAFIRCASNRTRVLDTRH